MPWAADESVWTRSRMFTPIYFMNSCTPRPIIDTPETPYPDQWLQLDDIFADSCFILETTTHTVWVFDEGEEEQTHKDDWEWEFKDPDLYLFNGSINLYSVPAEDDCRIQLRDDSDPPRDDPFASW